MFIPIDSLLAQHKLTLLRDHKDTTPRQFANVMREMGMVMAAEVMREIYRLVPPRMKSIVDKNGQQVENQPAFPKVSPILVPILRSGLNMAEGMRDALGTSYTGHIGLHHAIGTDIVDQYLFAVPEHAEGRRFFLVDPVIASGRTACAAIAALKEIGIKPADIFFVALIVGDVGMKLLQELHPDVQIFAIVFGEPVVDDDLSPGLGLISTRLFRTI